MDHKKDIHPFHQYNIPELGSYLYYHLKKSLFHYLMKSVQESGKTLSYFDEQIHQFGSDNR